METRWRIEEDGWSRDGNKINDPDRLHTIREALERGPVIVERRFYRGASAPERMLFEDWDEFRTWLTATFAGDSIYVWDYNALCRDDNPIAAGKSPDDAGEVPAGGAY
jgi:hypothetical protein